MDKEEIGRIRNIIFLIIIVGIGIYAITHEKVEKKEYTKDEICNLICINNDTFSGSYINKSCVCVPFFCNETYTNASYYVEDNRGEHFDFCSIDNKKRYHYICGDNLAALLKFDCNCSDGECV